MKRLCFVLGFISSLSLYADEADDKLNSFVDSFKGAGDSLGDIGEGMETMVYIPEKYKYSFQLTNEANVPLHVATYRIQPMLGGDIYTDTVLKEQVVAAGATSGNAFNDRQLKFMIKVRKNSASGPVIFIQRETDLGDTEQEGYFDTNYFRGFVKDGDVKVEYLGPTLTTTFFTGVMYNNTNADASLSFFKADKQYDVSLDPHSFNLLSSDDDIIRPLEDQTRSLTFNVGGATITKELSKEGVAGIPYTYEILMTNGLPAVYLQGFSLGNFDQIPKNAASQDDATRFRDINPIPCSIWLKSAAQGQPAGEGETAQTYFDEPYDTWVVYKTKDQTFKYKLEQGKSTDFHLLRPRLDEGQAQFTVIRVLTRNEVKARSFLDNIADGSIGQEARYIDVSKVPSGQEFTSIVPNTTGLVQDTASGVSGVVLLTDMVLPMGIGSPHMYYAIEPGTLQVDDLALSFFAYMKDDFATEDEFANMKSQLATWILSYITTSNSDAFRSYMQEKGNDILFAADTTEAIPFDGLLDGQRSLKNYPMLRFAGLSNFASAPDGIDQLEHVVY